MIEGMAECIRDEQFWDRLRIGAIYYIREIPNMRGHVIAMKDDCVPIIGVRLDRFKLLEDE